MGIQKTTSERAFSRSGLSYRRPRMLLTPNISCLLLFVASCVPVDSYRGREKIGNVGEFDARGSWEWSVEDFNFTDSRKPSVEEFDVSDSRRPSVEDFDGRTTSVENFGTPRTPTEGSPKRRKVGSWSPWSRKPKTNFPKRKNPETPRSRPDNSAVERIVVFPCQDEKLRCKHIPSDLESPFHCRWTTA